MNHTIHIAAVTQLRLDTDGRAYYRHKRAEGKKPMEALRCLKRRISDAIYRQLVIDAQRVADEHLEAGPGGHCGASLPSSAAGSHPHTALRISHFPDPRPRRYRSARPLPSPVRDRLLSSRADAPEPSRWSAPPDERP